MDRSLSEPLKRSVSRVRENVHAALDRWVHLHKPSGMEGSQKLRVGSSEALDRLRTNIHQADEVVVAAEMPGFDEKDFSVEVMDDRLILRGSKKQETEERGRNYYYSERSFGGFTRVLPSRVR